ncbi:hypothetical protein TNCV_1088661 [Trichonephila clavipes]|uniref:Uncharacterized protein n=1 Tax=Trichonephila clavipes TaxID=2585209 RepID=A0A8X6VQZ9_TRICX|nr:hypothetical protein TNCV_1088661 [Trichonephila clavipes]
MPDERKVLSYSGKPNEIFLWSFIRNLVPFVAKQPLRPGHQHSLVDAVAFSSYPRHVGLERDLVIWLAKELFEKL